MGRLFVHETHVDNSNYRSLLKHASFIEIFFAGPVTVPMVSTNTSPPIAMPVTVPAGHVVQQIVDESGTLRHVILSPQHPAGLVSLQPHSQTYVSIFQEQEYILLNNQNVGNCVDTNITNK